MNKTILALLLILIPSAANAGLLSYDCTANSDSRTTRHWVIDLEKRQLQTTGLSDKPIADAGFARILPIDVADTTVTVHGQNFLKENTVDTVISLQTGKGQVTVKETGATFPMECRPGAPVTAFLEPIIKADNEGVLSMLCEETYPLSDKEKGGQVKAGEVVTFVLGKNPVYAKSSLDSAGEFAWFGKVGVPGSDMTVICPAGNCVESGFMVNLRTGGLWEMTSRKLTGKFNPERLAFQCKQIDRPKDSKIQLY